MRGMCLSLAPQVMSVVDKLIHNFLRTSVSVCGKRPVGGS